MAPPAEGDAAPRRRWPPRLHLAAAIGWASFLAACVGTMLAFAALDPQLIIDGVERGEPGGAPWWLTPTGIYTLGFFLFWLIGIVAGILAAVLTETHPGEGHGP